VVQRDLAQGKKNAELRKATVIFVDESGFDLSPHVCRTWAPIGHTPVLKFPLRRGRISAISGVTLDDRVYFRLCRSAVKGHDVAVFLRQLLRCIEGPIVLVWDGIPIHRAREVLLEIEAAKGRLDVHRLPAYAPELNPDEYLWNWLKNKKLVNRAFNTLDDLAVGLRKAIRAVRFSAYLIQSFYEATPLSEPNKKKIPKLCAG